MMLPTLTRVLLCVPLALALLAGTPSGSLRLERESEEAPAPAGEECSSLYAVPHAARHPRRARHSLEQHFRVRVCVNHRHPASSGAGRQYLAKDGHELSNGLRAPLLT
jgi:hypothetical protein